jgi:hypothetical protein
MPILHHKQTNADLRKPLDLSTSTFNYFSSLKNIQFINIVKGGYGLDDETCLAFLTYYPAVNVTSCGSMINTKRFLEITDYIPM